MKIFFFFRSMGRIAIKFVTDIHGSQAMYSNDICHPLTISDTTSMSEFSLVQ